MALAYRVADRMHEKYPCQRCGDCCNQEEILVKDDEMLRIAEHLSVDVDEFRDRYLKESNGEMVLRKPCPCTFLKDGSCSIHDDRPDVCRRFPYSSAWFLENVATMMCYGAGRVPIHIREGCPCGEDLTIRLNRTIREVMLEEALDDS